MEKILVTGGAGYLGSILVPELLNAGFQVTVVDNFYFNQASLQSSCANPNFDIVRADCRDLKSFKKTLVEADIIIPLAALVGAPLCKKDAEGAQSINFRSIVDLLTQLSPHQKVIYPTTNSGYGIGEKGKACTELTPLQPISLYGRTKVDAEKAILDRGNCITLRLATVFGMSPRMRLDLLVNDFVYRAVNDNAVVIFEGNFSRNYIHIRDVANAFLHCNSNFEKMKNEPYNLGLSSANLTKLELCSRIKALLPQFVYLEAPVGEDPDKRDYIVSNEKIEKTGWRPFFTLEAGIQELIKGYKMIKNTQFSNV